MGKFDGILICSDLDGTFTGSDEIISKNKEAVSYFISEGGKFTFATGRIADHLQKINLLDCINAPACLVNGSIVYDYENKEILREKRLSFTSGEFAEILQKFFPDDIEVNIYNGCEGEASASCYVSGVPNDIRNIKPLKIVCRFKTVEDADNFKKSAISNPQFKDCYIAKSWGTGVEFNSIHATKGDAIKFIKKHLNDIHTCVGIGNYENDIPLLQDADIGVAVGNAIDSVKDVADIIVKRNDEYAIADLIDILEERKNYDY